MLLAIKLVLTKDNFTDITYGSGALQFKLRQPPWISKDLARPNRTNSGAIIVFRLEFVRFDYSFSRLLKLIWTIYLEAFERRISHSIHANTSL
jgi:hypothetical protein